MKKYFLTILAVLFTFNAYAADIKIGYIDLNRALNDSDAGKTASATLENMIKAKQAEILEKGKKIKALEEALVKQAAILTEEAAKEKKDEHDRLLRNYQRMVKDSQEEVQKKQKELMENILKEIRKTVTQLGKDEGYTMIFEKAESILLYHSDEIDLTAKTIQQFNEDSKKAQ